MEGFLWNANFVSGAFLVKLSLGKGDHFLVGRNDRRSAGLVHQKYVFLTMPPKGKKILNPATGRLVLASGKLGKEIVDYQKRRGPTRKSESSEDDSDDSVAYDTEETNAKTTDAETDDSETGSSETDADTNAGSEEEYTEAETENDNATDATTDEAEEEEDTVDETDGDTDNESVEPGRRTKEVKKQSHRGNALQMNSSPGHESPDESDLNVEIDGVLIPFGRNHQKRAK